MPLEIFKELKKWLKKNKTKQKTQSYKKLVQLIKKRSQTQILKHLNIQ